MKTPESYEKADIDKFLDALQPDLFYFKPSMNGYGKAGVSDRVGWYKGKPFVIEVKRYGKEPTAIQWRRMQEAKAAGGLGFWGTAEKVIPELKQAFGV